MSDKRKPIPKAIQTKVLHACRRRCCLCWHLERDDSEQAGQIAHADRDPSNNAVDNLAFLCLPHHNQYDSTSRQAKGLTEAELGRARADLLEHLRQSSQTAGHVPATDHPANTPAAPMLAADSRIRRYVVFCRIVDLNTLATNELAAAQRVLMEVVEKARQEPTLKVRDVHSSVYGRLLCVCDPVPALQAAERVLDQSAKRGVRLAIGITVGEIERVDDLGGKNLIGPAINLAARLAAQEKVNDQIVLTPEVFEAVCLTDSKHRKTSFSGPLPGEAKKTKFEYYLRLHTAPHHGSLPKTDQTTAFDAHAVVFDIAQFTKKGEDDQWLSVTMLHRTVLKEIQSLGLHDRASHQQLWHAPTGDGGVLVFSPEAGGGSAAWLFARELARHCRGQVEIRLGLATGPAVVLPGQLPVGPCILRADNLCNHPPSWGWCADLAFWKGVPELERKHWQTTPLPDDPKALLIHRKGRQPGRAAARTKSNANATAVHPGTANPT